MYDIALHGQIAGLDDGILIPDDPGPGGATDWTPSPWIMADNAPVIQPTTPGAVAVTPSAWNTAGTPATYRVQSGDTYVGLATTYLNDGGRWREIFNFQDTAIRQQGSGNIIVGQTLKMPAEAEKNYRAYLKQKGLPQPVGPRGGVMGWPTWKRAAVGGGIAAALAGAWYYLK